MENATLKSGKPTGPIAIPFTHVLPQPAFPLRDDYDGLLCEKNFKEMIDLERKRKERSKRNFLLGLINIEKAAKNNSNGFVRQVASALSLFTREIDIKGWYRHASVIGILITEIGNDDLDDTKEILQKRLAEILQNSLAAEILNNLDISFHSSRTSRLGFNAQALYS